MAKKGLLSSVPYRSFNGWLKCQRPYHRNELGQLVSNTTFPLFSTESIDAKLSDVESSLNDTARELGMEVMMGPAVRFRRFAGDRKGHLSLDRGRYYTVCKDESGFDSGTLANEFNAYCNPKEVGFAWTYDQAMENPPVQVVSIFLKDLPGAPSTALTEARRQGLLPPDTTAVRVDIPYAVSEMALEKVVDLRYPDARQWLFEEFGAGKPGMLERNAPKPAADASFFNMLPWLMIRDNGGDGLTNTIGAYLRKIGVDALIFPSARSDTFVEFRDGELVDFGGWNLVDYRNASEAPAEETLLLFGDWTGFRDRSSNGLVDWTTKISLPPDNSEFEGSFRIVGNQSHHMLLLHNLLCFRIWDEAGSDVEVKGYRWHSTREVRQPEGSLCYVTCLECGYELPPISTVEDLFAVESACPNCGSTSMHLP